MEQLSVYDKLKDNRSIPIQNIIKTFIFDEFPKLATQIDKKALGQKFQNFITIISSFCIHYLKVKKQSRFWLWPTSREFFRLKKSTTNLH